jgi:LPXTG-motif cell wall-anchored protein
VETKALDGYTLDSTEHEVTFEYVDDATSVIEVTFDLKNEKQEKHSGNPKTGDETNLWIPILLMAVSVCGMAALVIRRRKK